MDSSSSPNVQRLNPDILFLILSHVVKIDIPVLCSCSKHAPTPAELRQRPCCDKFPRCTSCVFGKSSAAECVHNLGWVKLGHVCRQWRSILQETSAFWANDLCALNNSALVEFLSLAGSAPLVIDLTPEQVQNMVHPATRRERAELLRPHVHEARVLCSGWYSWIPATLGEHPLPILQTLVLSTEDPSTVAAPTLRHAVSNDGPLDHHPTHIISDEPLVLQAPLLQTLHLRHWSPSRYEEIPGMLTTISHISELVLESEDPWTHYRPVETEDAQDTEDSLTRLVSPLHLPCLSKLRVIGHVEYPVIQKLLTHLTTSSLATLQQLHLQHIDPSLLQSPAIFDALKMHAHAICPDSISLQFQDYNNVFTMSVARHVPKSGYEKYTMTTIGLDFHSPQGFIDLLKTKLFSLVPVEQLYHLFLDSLPASAGTQFQFSSALRHLSSVHTLHLRPGQVESASLLSIGTYPMVGLRSDPWLPTLAHLHITAPSSDPSKIWWNELVTALNERKNIGVPFNDVRIVVHQDPNILRQVYDARLFLQLMRGAGLPVDNNRWNDVFNGAGLDWTRERVAYEAGIRLAQVVETIEVVEGSSQDAWPPPNVSRARLRGMHWAWIV